MGDDEIASLVLISPNIDASQYLSLCALVRVIKKSSEIKLLNSPVLSKYSDLQDLGEYTKLDELSEQKYLLQFENQVDKVDSIQWNQNEKHLNIYVSMQKGTFNTENITFDSVGEEFTTVYTFGMSSLEDLGDLYSPSKDYIFENVEIISFGSALKIKGKKITSYGENQRVNVPIGVYLYIMDCSLDMDELSATYLLASIYLSSSNFTQISDPEVFSISGKLLDAGASIQKVNDIINKLPK